MSRGVEDENYYVSRGGKIPVKWTAPEVMWQILTWETQNYLQSLFYKTCRHFTIRSTPLPVMCGALVVSCMRYGVSDTNLLRCSQMQRLLYSHIFSIIYTRLSLMIHCMQTLKLVDKGYLLSPPPGMSKELYKIMIQCWYRSF